MPKLVQPQSLDEMYAAEAVNILNKALIRTALVNEKHFGGKPEERNADVVAYEIEHYDNPQSPLYRDSGAATMYAALKGIKSPGFKTSTAMRIDLDLALVVVPVNSRNYTHPEGVAVDQPYVCVNTTSGKFRTTDGAKTSTPLKVNTLTVRAATEEEIKAVIAAQMAARPAQTVKTLGDALETRFGSSDDE